MSDRIAGASIVAGYARHRLRHEYEFAIDKIRDGPAEIHGTEPRTPETKGIVHQADQENPSEFLAVIDKFLIGK